MTHINSVSLVEMRRQTTGREPSNAITTLVAQVSNQGLVLPTGKVTRLLRVCIENKNISIYMYILKSADVNIIFANFSFQLNPSTFFKPVSHSCAAAVTLTHMKR